MSKLSIRFFGDREVRAVWDAESAKWRFSVLDIVGVLRGERRLPEKQELLEISEGETETRKSSTG